MRTANGTAESRSFGEAARAAIGGPVASSPAPSHAGGSWRERWPVDLLVLIAALAVAGAAALGGLAVTSAWMTLARSQAAYSLSGDLESGADADPGAGPFRDEPLCCHETP